ncbi:MAG: class I SAM-dependent rRNA methyltransferase [Thermodesulfobacteriota bacterium]
MIMETVVLNRTSRLLAGHLWVFSNELKDSPKAFTPGAIVELRDRKGVYLGKGYINPHSLIAVRVLTRGKEEIDRSFFRARIENALAYRRRFIEGQSFRVVFSEADGLPGLVVDKYGDCLSIQVLTLGMEGWTDVITGLLDEIFDPKVMVLRNDSSARALEGIALEKKVIKGGLEELPRMEENGCVLEVDPISGQKTGLFLDQRENRTEFSRLASGGEKALDLFSYTGAWAINLAKMGVTVTGVDASEGAVAQARRNAELNGLADSCEFVKANVFDFVKKDLAAGAAYDMIVLDPPAFVKSKSKVREGLRSYRELNGACMSMLKGGGLFATSTCSYHVDRNTFLDLLRDAARDAGKTARIIEVRSQARDHPIALSVPETEYLKCVIAEVR